jgi:uncharacterized protein YggE
MRHLLTVLWAFALLAAPAAAQTSRRSVRATGDAVISVRPDLAKLAVSVITQGVTAEEAGAMNASKVEAVLAALRRVLGSDATIQTISYSLTPNYKYPTGGGQPTLVGYTASNSVEVTTPDLTILGRLIDTATTAGATTVSSLRFTLRNELPHKLEALKLAAANAREKAKAIAAGLGLSLGYVLIADEGVTVRYSTDTRTDAGTATTTPIETGMVTVHATVTVEMEITP